MSYSSIKKKEEKGKRKDNNNKNKSRLTSSFLLYIVRVSH